MMTGRVAMPCPETYLLMLLQISIKGDCDARKKKGGWGAQGGERSASLRNACRDNICFGIVAIDADEVVVMAVALMTRMMTVMMMMMMMMMM